MPDWSALAGNINLDESSMPDLSKLIKLDDLDLDLSHMIDPEEILKNLPADQVPDMSQALKSVKFDFTEGEGNCFAERGSYWLSGKH